jgi:HEPN domain-containing protein
MYEIEARAFFTAVRALTNLQRLIQEMCREREPNAEIENREFRIMEAAGLRQLSDTLSVLNVPVTNQAIEEAITCLSVGGPLATYDEYSRLIDHITRNLSRELKSRSLFSLSVDEYALFSPPDYLFGDAMNTAFPKARYDISEAGKCLSMGRSTASVFHCMRVVEAVLQAVYQCLGMQLPTNRNWGILLRALDDEITSRKQAWTEFDYFKSLYARFDAIKDAWRNATMHVENIYTESEARDIFSNVKFLCQKVADRMDENGDPKA